MSEVKSCLQGATNYGDGAGPMEIHKTKPSATGAVDKEQNPSIHHYELSLNEPNRMAKVKNDDNTKRWR